MGCILFGRALLDVTMLGIDPEGWSQWDEGTTVAKVVCHGLDMRCCMQEKSECAMAWQMPGCLAIVWLRFASGSVGRKMRVQWAGAIRGGGRMQDGKEW